MKLSMWSSFYLAETPEDMVLKLLKGGFKYTELSFEHSKILMDRGPQAYAAFKTFMDDHGFATPQGHLNFAENTGGIPKANVDLATWDEKLRRVSIDGWKRELELFEAIGIERAVLHPGGIAAFLRGEHTMAEVDELRLAGLNELLDFTAGMKVMICVENMTTGRYMSTSESLLNFIHSADRKNVGICLDTGHLNIRKMEEHEDFIRACGKDLQALHIADNNGGWDEHLMPFSGTVNWKKTVAALEDIGYDRLVNFEVPGSSWRICNGDAELRDQFLPFARLLGEKLFGGLK